MRNIKEIMPNLSDKARKSAAILSSIIAFSGGLAASELVTNIASANATSTSPAQLLYNCEIDGLYSLENASENPVRTKDGLSLTLIRQHVMARALPANCDNLVDRTIKAGEVAAKNPNPKYFDTRFEDIAFGDNTINKSIVEKRFHPYMCGEYIKQVVEIEVNQVNGNQNFDKVYESAHAARSC